MSSFSDELRLKAGCPRKLFVFTKPAVPGSVKTRLIGELTAEQTAELHGAFLSDVCLEITTGGLEVGLAWALDKSEALPEGVGSRRIPGWRQEGEDLGARLFNVLSLAASSGAHVAALGSDHPEVTREVLESAFDRLDDGADLVIGPTPDGGYFLIACSAPSLHSHLFEDIEWSTDVVREQTLARAADLDLSVELLPEGHDVDVPADLDALVRRLELNEGGCPATRDLLRRWGRLSNPPGGLQEDYR